MPPPDDCCRRASSEEKPPYLTQASTNSQPMQRCALAVTGSLAGATARPGAPVAAAATATRIGPEPAGRTKALHLLRRDAAKLAAVLARFLTLLRAPPVQARQSRWQTHHVGKCMRTSLRRSRSSSSSQIARDFSRTLRPWSYAAQATGSSSRKHYVRSGVHGAQGPKSQPQTCPPSEC